MSGADQNGAASKGSWTSFLKSISSFNGDLSTMTAPAWILSTTSLTEFSKYWAEMPRLLVAPADEPDPARRAMLVLRWFLSTLRQQYASRNEKLGSEKKPLNPFLGELFLGTWDDDAGQTRLVSEQVSHHPPVTAYSIVNEAHGVRLEGYNAQKASFSRTINVRQVGHAVLHLDRYDEDYLITLPSLHIEGLMGTPYVELNHHSYIVGSNGYTARIDYSGRGWVSGVKNTLSATLYPHGHEKDKSAVLYTADGSWTDSFTIRDAQKNVVETYNSHAEPKAPLAVASLDAQDPLESRRAWQKVANAIEKGDMTATAREKSIIEDQQRALRKKETAENRDWERRFFVRADRQPAFDRLIAQVPGGALEPDLTNGVWLFDPEKARDAKPPYTALSEELKDGSQ